jgi:prepilin-type processing-associated H-X9-DG protein
MSPNSVRKWFYCPSNKEYDLDQYWQPVGGAGTNRRLGYAYLNERGLPAYLPSQVKPSVRLAPPLEWRKTWNPNNGTQLEIIEDLIMNATDPTANPVYDNSINASTGVYINSVSHLNGSKPAGANVLCCDGHVEWRAWPGGSKVHWVPCGGGPSGNTNFILINP